MCTCFSLSSLSYLLWLYRLLGFTSASLADAMTMVFGYFAQAVGLAVAALVMSKKPVWTAPTLFSVAIAMHLACAVPAAMGTGFVSIASFGLVANVFCGIVAAYYLRAIAVHARSTRFGIVFGAGYAVSVVGTWLLSIVLGDLSAQAPAVLAICAGLGIVAIALAFMLEDDATGSPHTVLDAGTAGALDETPGRSPEGTGLFAIESRQGMHAEPQSTPSSMHTERRDAGTQNVATSFIALAAATVLLVSLVKNMGAAFSATDLGVNVNLELSRLFYATGLILAGVVADRSRKACAICCFAGLATPFALMALAGSGLPSVGLWALDYFLYGFFSVFRIVLFLDVALAFRNPELAGLGLLFGRVGDAVGEGICLSLASGGLGLVAVTIVMFVCSVIAFFQLFQRLYMPVPVVVKSEGERFDLFAARIDASVREREVLQLLLDGRTNAEIAGELSVTENTVKYHVRNLLKKSGCANRQEIIALYARD